MSILSVLMSLLNGFSHICPNSFSWGHSGRVPAIRLSDRSLGDEKSVLAGGVDLLRLTSRWDAATEDRGGCQSDCLWQGKVPSHSERHRWLHTSPEGHKDRKRCSSYESKTAPPPVALYNAIRESLCVWGRLQTTPTKKNSTRWCCPIIRRSWEKRRKDSDRSFFSKNFSETSFLYLSIESIISSQTGLTRDHFKGFNSVYQLSILGSFCWLVDKLESRTFWPLFESW